MPATLTVRCLESTRDVTAVWIGETLAVHRPLTKKGASNAPRHWGITHRPTGLSVTTLNVAKNDAVALAKLWDAAAASIDPKNPRMWQHLAAFRDDLGRVGSLPLKGPVTVDPLQRLENAQTFAEVRDAVAAAMGHVAVPDDDAAEPFPVAENLPRDRWRDGADGPEVRWRGRWWPVPTMGEVETWLLDSVAESPDGRTVETDAPDAWPVILGVM
jgi:hypothetical protein